VVVTPGCPGRRDVRGGWDRLLRAQLQAPSLRQLFFPELSPIDAAALPATPSRFNDLRFTPFSLLPNEQLGAFVTNGGAAQTQVGVWLSDGPIAPVAGPVRTLRWTHGHADGQRLVARIAITLDQTLPSGRYQLVGARMWGTSPILFRFGVPGYQWKPGGSRWRRRRVSSIRRSGWRHGGLAGVHEREPTDARRAGNGGRHRADGEIDVIYLGP